jgi:hypothetical protein
MSIYQCISPEGLRDESQRENIAEEITRIHKAARSSPSPVRNNNGSNKRNYADP